MLRSALLETRYLPSGLHPTLQTASEWSLRVSSSLPDAISHTFKVLSTLAVAIFVPSGGSRTAPARRQPLAVFGIDERAHRTQVSSPGLFQLPGLHLPELHRLIHADGQYLAVRAEGQRGDRGEDFRFSIVRPWGIGC